MIKENEKIIDYMHIRKELMVKDNTLQDIKLIASDMDHTLLTEESNVYPKGNVSKSAEQAHFYER